MSHDITDIRPDFKDGDNILWKKVFAALTDYDASFNYKELGAFYCYAIDSETGPHKEWMKLIPCNNGEPVDEEIKDALYQFNIDLDEATENADIDCGFVAPKIKEVGVRERIPNWQEEVRNDRAGSALQAIRYLKKAERMVKKRYKTLVAPVFGLKP